MPRMGGPPPRSGYLAPYNIVPVHLLDIDVQTRTLGCNVRTSMSKIEHLRSGAFWFGHSSNTMSETKHFRCQTTVFLLCFGTKMSETKRFLKVAFCFGHTWTCVTKRERSVHAFRHQCPRDTPGVHPFGHQCPRNRLLPGHGPYGNIINTLSLVPSFAKGTDFNEPPK